MKYTVKDLNEAKDRTMSLNNQLAKSLESMSRMVTGMLGYNVGASLRKTDHNLEWYDELVFYKVFGDETVDFEHPITMQDIMEKFSKNQAL